MPKYLGTIFAYFETGCEGLLWALKEDCKSFNDGLRFIEQGDHLIVYGENGEMVFDGDIIEDREIGWQEYPRNPGYGQPCALGYWIHWTQQGWQPDDWAKLFLWKHIEGMKGLSLRAELTKNAS